MSVRMYCMHMPNSLVPYSRKKEHVMHVVPTSCLQFHVIPRSPYRSVLVIPAVALPSCYEVCVGMGVRGRCVPFNGSGRNDGMRESEGDAGQHPSRNCDPGERWV